jgi:hypothetical protein
MPVLRMTFLLTLAIIFVSGCASPDQSGSVQKTTAKKTGVKPISYVDTGFLENTPGFKGELIGAEVEDVKFNTDGDYQVIRVSVPVDPDSVDTVKVFTESGEPIPQPREAEIVKNYENERVDMLIFLSKRKNIGFRLRLIDNLSDQ